MAPCKNKAHPSGGGEVQEGEILMRFCFLLSMSQSSMLSAIKKKKKKFQFNYGKNNTIFVISLVLVKVSLCNSGHDLIKAACVCTSLSTSSVFLFICLSAIYDSSLFVFYLGLLSYIKLSKKLSQILFVLSLVDCVCMMILNLFVCLCVCV
jgi:hypothetical protein